MIGSGNDKALWCNEGVFAAGEYELILAGHAMAMRVRVAARDMTGASGSGVAVAGGRGAWMLVNIYRLPCYLHGINIATVGEKARGGIWKNEGGGWQLEGGSQRAGREAGEGTEKENGRQGVNRLPRAAR